MNTESLPFLLGLSILLLSLPVYSYLLYPLLLKAFPKQFPISNNKTLNNPAVIILIAAFNEEKVIAKKLQSIIDSDFSYDNLEVWVGSDASTDATDSIVQEFSARYPFIHLVRMEGRVGKPSIINRLFELAKASEKPESIIILTDANVFFEKEMLQRLCNAFSNPSIGLVGANVINAIPENSRIGMLEGLYIDRENSLKQLESDWGGVLMGPFGACFALRASAFVPIPAHYIVDDFYWCMIVLRKGLKACFDRNAICYEDLPGDLSEEFRRKRRIAYGNMQNLLHFVDLLKNPFSKVSIAFWSHKILRWFSPLFVIIAMVLLAIMNLFVLLKVCIAVVGLVLILEIIGIVLRIKRSPLRAILYFCLMNIAVMVGMMDFVLKKRKQARWNPTKRTV